MNGASPGNRPPINFDAISDAMTLKALLRAQQEKMSALERRLQGQDNSGGGASRSVGRDTAQAERGMQHPDGQRINSRRMGSRYQ